MKRLEVAVVMGALALSTRVPLLRAQAPDSAVVAWAAVSMHPLAAPGDTTTSDLGPLLRMARDARVVAFGETAHHTHEIQLERWRMFRALAHEPRVRVLAMETGYAEALEVDAWVHGARGGELDFRKAFPFAGDGDQGELQAAVTWLHARNGLLPAAQRIGVMGIDMSGGGGDRQSSAPHGRSSLPIQPDDRAERLRARPSCR